MSLKARIIVLIVALVTVVVTSLSALHLSSLLDVWSSDALANSVRAAQQVQAFLSDRINTVELPAAASLDEIKRIWSHTVADQPDISVMLEKTMAYSRMIVEIEVAGEDGRILASSNPRRIQTPIHHLPAFEQWHDKGVLQRLWEIASRQEDYEVTVPLGTPGQPNPIFTIQVVVSSVILRNDLLPRLQNLAWVSGGSLALAILLAVLAAKLALRPLKRISQTIDHITEGQFTPAEKVGTGTREFAVVQTKLNVLGQQYRGAQAGASQLRSNVERLLEGLEEGVLLFDKDQKLLLASLPVERFLGLPRNLLLGLALEEIFPVETPLGAVIRHALDAKRSTKNRLATTESRNGQPPQVLVSVELLGDTAAERLSGTLVTLRDAETRRQLASQLDVSSRLSAISRLTGGVAHEIKNPLNAIALRLELVRNKLANQNPDMDNEISIISGEITRLDRVVKTFLDFTRPVDLAMRSVDLSALVREVTSLMAPQARLQNVTIDVAVPAAPAIIRGDPDLLKQAILNVVMNGMEAMKQGGSLEVHLSREDSQCIVRISDQGPGIPPELQAKVFQLYFSTKEKGSGIGLAMTFRAVQLHNGTIDFTSEVGQGTTFRLIFPLTTETGSSEPSVAPA